MVLLLKLRHISFTDRPHHILKKNALKVFTTVTNFHNQRSTIKVGTWLKEYELYVLKVVSKKMCMYVFDDCWGSGTGVCTCGV